MVMALVMASVNREEIHLPLRRSSYLFLFQIRSTGMPFTLYLPLPLFILEDFFSSLHTLLQGVILLFPALSKRIEKKCTTLHLDIALTDISCLLMNLAQKFRSLGPFTLVEVDNGEGTRIIIRFL